MGGNKVVRVRVRHGKDAVVGLGKKFRLPLLLSNISGAVVEVQSEEATLKLADIQCPIRMRELASIQFRQPAPS